MCACSSSARGSGCRRWPPRSAAQTCSLPTGRTTQSSCSAPTPSGTGSQLRAEVVRWDEPDTLLREAPWPLVLGADLLYELRNADTLLELLPRLGADVLLADPGRPFVKGFIERAAERWEIQTETDESVDLHRLRLR